MYLYIHTHKININGIKQVLQNAFFGLEVVYRLILCNKSSKKQEERLNVVAEQTHLKENMYINM